MAALTTDNTLFGARGVSDPESYACPNRTIRRIFDFAKAPVTGSTNYEFIWLPKGFLMTGMKVRELSKCSASSTVTLKTKADSATIGAAVNVGDSTLADAWNTPVAATKAKDEAGTGTVTVPGASKFIPAGDMLCLVPGASFTEGVVEVTVFGVSTDGQSFDKGLVPPPEYRNGQSDQQFEGNRSGGDLLNPQV